ncbi:uncharacterized protein LOC141719590 [Apium graveolens]|uniref:uncharacterized protein LOC141719590 n=1 Tax=Apium graveolens TaxID=4045 RepID=UPI003D794A14
MKVQADKHRIKREFNIGDWVWLKTQPYRQVTVQQKSNQKLASAYCGAFQIIEKVGKVTYKLRLSSEVKIHNVVHVSQLKAFHGDSPMLSVPNWVQQPAKSKSTVVVTILDHGMLNVQNKAQVQYLVKWKDASMLIIVGRMLKHLLTSFLQSYFKT